MQSTGLFVCGTIDRTILLFPFFVVLTYVLLVPALCFLGRRLNISVQVPLAVHGDGPVFVCHGCGEAFLCPGTAASEWWSAVKCGSINDTTSGNFKRQLRLAEGFAEYK